MPNVRRGVVVLGPPAIVALLGIITALGVRRERVETGWVTHSYVVRGKIDEAFTVLRDVEAGVRGFVITGDTASLLAYRTRLPAAVNAVNDIRALTADNPVQGARVARLDTLVTAKVAEFHAVVAAASAGGLDSARTLVRRSQQRRLVNNIRTLLARMDADEAELLGSRLRNVERQRRIVILVVVIGTVVATALAWLALQMLLRGSRQLESQRAALARNRDELLETTEQLKARTLAAEEANRAKAQFLTTMSHELRTPLNAIDGYAELIEMELRGPITPEQAQDLARIRRSQRHLLSLVNDVLNFARLEAGRIEWDITDVALDDTLQVVEALLRPQLESKGISYRRDGTGSGVLVHADEEKLRQILLNLLTNAYKFTPSGGEVSIHCEADERDVRIKVRDTGRGIPADKIATVFDPFVQVDRHLTGDSQQGVGLGLAISRDLARGMNGDLDVTSTSGVGSEFVLSIPRGGYRSKTPSPDAADQSL